MKKIIAGIVLALGLVGAANAEQYVQGDRVSNVLPLHLL